MLVKKRSLLIYCLIAVLLISAMCLPLFPVSVEENTVDIACGLSAVEFYETIGNGTFSVGASSAILIDADSGSVLFAQNADLERGMASTTKIMTALVILETLAPETVVEITQEMTGVEGSSLYLLPGEHLTVEQLLYGLLLESGNDAAVALALACDGSIEAFADRMNAKAKQLGLEHTHFVNPHGLSAAGHYTTARELAMITLSALRNPLFREIVSTYQMRIPYNDQPDARYLTNHNPILRKYDGLIGVKTGWTTADGKCFVTAAERDGLTLIAVSLGDVNISTTHTALLDHGFAEFEAVPLQISAPLELPLVGGNEQYLSVEPSETLTVCLPKGETAAARIEAPSFLYAGTEAGSTVGRIIYEWNGIEVGSVPLITAEEAPVKRLSFWEKLFGMFKK